MIYDRNDTICAISTPPGTGGIAVIRVSGKHALDAVGKIWHGAILTDVKSHTAHLGEIVDPDSTKANEPLDQCVATVFKGPHSFTGEDTVEISVHGSKWVQRELISLLCHNGCRLAQPGEFSQRAVINGRMDLAQAEGTADLIAASSRASHRIAISQMKGNLTDRIARLRDALVDLSALMELELDFSEEDVTFADRKKLLILANEVSNEISSLHKTFSTGNAIKNGIPVAIVGPTNAGKSSLLNAIVDYDRAIVSDIHGTTRDTIEETAELGDYTFRFIDTAGIRDTSDPIEQIGIERSRNAAEKAHIVISVIDASQPMNVIPETTVGHTVIVLNKTDLLKKKEIISKSRKISASLPETTPIIPLSTKERTGMDTLLHTLQAIMDKEMAPEGDIIITNQRQAQALGEALDSIQTLISGLQSTLPTDLLVEHLRETIHHLSTLTGTIPSQEILNTIFSRFCIGK